MGGKSVFHFASAIAIAFFLLQPGSARAQDAAPPDKLDDLPAVVDEHGTPIPPPPPNVPRMRPPVPPASATEHPPDPLVDVIPIPPTDNRSGGDDPANWRPKRNIYTSTGDVLLVVAAAGVAVSAAIVSPQDERARGAVLFDEGVRDALRLRSSEGRYSIRDASDVGASLVTTWPFLVDALLTAWWYRGDVKLARNMALVAAEAISLSTAVQGVTNTIAARERPYGNLCGKEFPEGTVDCEGDVRYRSFFSGHAAAAFASAGVLCVHHLGLALIGGPWDAITCGTSVAVAGAVATFRVMSDMHYATDISLGALIGSGIGLAVPLLHLSPPVEHRAGRVEVRVSPVGQGLGVVGSF